MRSSELELILTQMESLSKKIDSLNEHHCMIEKRLARLEASQKYVWLLVPLLLTLHFL